MNANEPIIEELERDDRQVADLLGTLPRVEAPKDFDFRLKARMAQGRPSAAAAPFSLPVWLKFAAPTALLFIVGVFYFALPIRDAGPKGNEITAQAASPMPVVAVTPTIAPAPEIASVQPPISAPVTPSHLRPERIAVAQRTSMQKAMPARPAADANDGGGSIDRAVRGTSTTILPRGINTTPVNTAVTPPGFANAPNVSVRDVFSQLGVDAEYSNGWVVKNVRAHSVAGTAGLRSGDVIEAIDDKPISEVNEKGAFNGRAITVRRDGRSVKLTLTQ
ncbi:MAG: PDZ domain-containing protein [Pyrinomonadaceae bacterium]